MLSQDLLFWLLMEAQGAEVALRHKEGMSRGPGCGEEDPKDAGSPSSSTVKRS